MAGLRTRRDFPVSTDVRQNETTTRHFRLILKPGAADQLLQASRGDLKEAIDVSTQAIDLFTEMRDPYDAALVKYIWKKQRTRCVRASKSMPDVMDVTPNLVEPLLRSTRLYQTPPLLRSADVE
jgi:hypothetical protein